MERASDIERFFQCFTCCNLENCNLDEKAEDKRGMCTEHCLGDELKKKEIIKNKVNKDGRKTVF